MGERAQFFLTGKNPVNKDKRNNGNRKSPLGKHHNNNCCRQEPATDAKISGLECMRNRICAESQSICPQVNY